ncbi:RNA 2',3'-cyclic phosphodiesterase [Hyphomicrobium sp. LHD-15]|uniref:RNA 2',3'-cyclic phosphodiesterase n=1 Tax=Hyphomicrobium sp. LHD-15 TaxID=3072142 RepID=UPI00280E6792|nr:RNA 2',3'-cyclic phosphodiesterase [Hyphomicrobium sp. LHD-15]MDQ8698510.1 RNA 2',3'-cyclic phosphodiesterase [Hyphomicrobium sp. LHD-15]
MPRLFTGIELPSALADALSDLAMPLAGAKWVEPEDMHITLRFAGDIDNPTANDFHAALSGIDEPAFQISLSGFGAFGGQQPRALWAGVEQSPWLDALWRANERAARSAGLTSEKHSFKPHVTLARLKGTRPEAVARVLEQLGSFRTEPFQVERFVLFSSRPKVGGGPYVVEDAFDLRGAEYARQWNDI